MSFAPQSLLSNPFLLRLFKRLIGSGKVISFFVDSYIRPQQGCRIMDLGCGIGDILDFLPSVHYVGIDMSHNYIDAAIRKYGGRGIFRCEKIERDIINAYSSFDIVLAKGVLHHLNDDEALMLFEIAHSILAPSGRLVTFDGCYTKNQSIASRYLLSQDRGSYVRSEDEYVYLASKVFPAVKSSIHNNLLHIPYTHIVLECNP